MFGPLAVPGWPLLTPPAPPPTPPATLRTVRITNLALFWSFRHFVVSAVEVHFWNTFPITSKTKLVARCQLSTPCKKPSDAPWLVLCHLLGTTFVGNKEWETTRGPKPSHQLLTSNDFNALLLYFTETFPVLPFHSILLQRQHTSVPENTSP